MKSSTSRASHRVLAHLRREIVNRRLAPGARLPTRDNLVARLKVSKGTVQKALTELAGEGWVVPRGVAGTYVCEDVPFVVRYGLVFPWRPSAAKPWALFWKTIAHTATALARPGELEFVTYYAGAEASPADIATLNRDVTAHRVSGLIFTGPPWGLEGTPALTQENMPRVSITAGSLGFPRVWLDGAGFWQRAMEEVARRGRRRLAIVVAMIEEDCAAIEFCLATAKQWGLELRPEWVQNVPTAAPHGTPNLMRLLMSLPEERRPDSLIVFDDNLVEHALRGLLEAGVDVGRDVDVVAGCNHPLERPDVLPVCRLGYDSRELVQACVHALELQRHGQAASPATVIRARFAHELKASAALQLSANAG
jgi:DNA-binding LacI/PurR family transcriptional regulator